MAEQLLPPNDLSAILRTGATYEGRAVRRIVLVFDGGKLATVLPELASESPVIEPIEAIEDTVLRLLGSLQAGEYMTGRTLAEKCELTYGGGRFNNLMAILRADNLIESHKVHGYRLKRLS
jgi:hypothetical protein